VTRRNIFGKIFDEVYESIEVETSELVPIKILRPVRKKKNSKKS
jgi:hypothetical protein